MTEKELLYVQDAISHLKMLKKKCEAYEGIVQDANLKKFVCDIKTKQVELHQKFYNLLGGM